MGRAASGGLINMRGWPRAWNIWLISGCISDGPAGSAEEEVSVKTLEENATLAADPAAGKGTFRTLLR